MVSIPPILAAAPTPSDAIAQELQRHQERERLLRQEQEARPDARLPCETTSAVSELIPHNAPRVDITCIALTGDEASRFEFALNKSVTDGEDAAVGRCLGAQGINAVLARMQNANLVTTGGINNSGTV